MSLTLRIMLIAAALIANVSVIRRIRKAKLKIDDAVFWVIFSLIILLIAVYPRIIYFLSDISGVRSPANLLYLLIISVLLVKIFSMSIKISTLEDKFKSLVQKLSLEEEDKKK
jgi:hypothetical protein